MAFERDDRYAREFIAEHSSQRGKSAVHVLADRVVAPGDDEIELAFLQQRQCQPDRSEARRACRTRRGGEPVQLEVARGLIKRCGGEEVSQRFVAAGAEE